MVDRNTIFLVKIYNRNPRASARNRFFSF